VGGKREILAFAKIKISMQRRGEERRGEERRRQISIEPGLNNN
jgi:hypothetical protein